MNGRRKMVTQAYRSLITLSKCVSEACNEVSRVARMAFKIAEENQRDNEDKSDRREYWLVPLNMKLTDQVLSRKPMNAKARSQL